MMTTEAIDVRPMTEATHLQIAQLTVQFYKAFALWAGLSGIFVGFASAGFFLGTGSYVRDWARFFWIFAWLAGGSSWVFAWRTHRILAEMKRAVAGERTS